MSIKNGLLFLAIFLLFASGCHHQSAISKQFLTPTAFEDLSVKNTIHPELVSTYKPTITELKERPDTPARETTNPVSQKPILTDASPKKPISNLQNDPPIDEQIDQIIAQSGGRWHIIIKEVDGNILYSRLPDQRINIASVVKVPFALLFFEALKENGIPEGELQE